MTFDLANLDPFNALDIGSLSVPLVFQVTHRCTCAAHCHPVSPDQAEPTKWLRQHVMCIGIPRVSVLSQSSQRWRSKHSLSPAGKIQQSKPHRLPKQLTSRSSS